jgi:calcium-dependent protein kinase
VPDNFPKILKDYTKEVVRKGIQGEQDIIKYSMVYFEQLLRERIENGGNTASHGSLKGGVHQHKPTQMIVHKHGESVLDHYYITGIIGNPYDSKARLGLHKVTGLERAIKEVSKANISDLADFLKKVKIVASLDHPNICKYLELFEDEYSYYFVSEYLTGGDLWDAVHGLFGGFGGYTEETTANVIKQLLQSVSYLHKKGIVHRNIRSGNILFAERGKIDIKLIDFDVAGTKTMEALSVNGGGLHGPYYSAPEVFKNDHNEKVDIWSIGVVLYFMLVGSLPFNGDSNEAVVAAIQKGKMVHPNEMLWKSITSEARDLIEQLLTVNP